MPFDAFDAIDELDDAFDLMPFLAFFAAIRSLTGTPVAGRFEVTVAVAGFSKLLMTRFFARVAGGEYKNGRLFRLFAYCFSNNSNLP